MRNKKTAPCVYNRPPWGGVQRLLETPITINGALAPRGAFTAKQATLTGWPEYYTQANTFTLLDLAGAAPTLATGSPYGGALDDSITCVSGNGDCFQAAAVNYLDLTTEDFFIEYLIRGSVTTTNLDIFSKLHASPSYGGYQAYWDQATKAIVTRMAVASTFRGSTTATGLTGWLLVHAFFNRDEATTNGSQSYVNGVASGAGVDVSACAGSITSTNKFVIGGRVGANVTYDNPIAYIMVAARASGWFQAGAAGPAEWASIAAQRMALLTATRPAFSWGGIVAPSVATRTTSGYAFNAQGTSLVSYEYGTNGIRTSTRKDESDRAFVGRLIGAQAQNLCVQSDALGTTWTAVNLTSTTANGANASDGQATLDGAVGDATSGQHGWTQAITLTAVNYTISGTARVGNKTWLYVEDATVANATAYFDITNAVVGTKGAGFSAIYIRALGGGLVEWECVVLGTAAAHTIGIYAADADGDNSFEGDAATVNVWVGEINVETGARRSGRIKTTTAAVTQTADSLRYVATNNINQLMGTLRVRFLMPAMTPTRAHYICSINTGGSSADAITLYIHTDGTICASSAKTGGDAGAVSCAGSVCDNVPREVLLNWSENKLELYCLNESTGALTYAVDSDCDMPTALDRIDWGSDHTPANQFGPGLIGGYKFFPKPQISFYDRGSGFKWL